MEDNNNFPKDLPVEEEDNEKINEDDLFINKYNKIKPQVKTISLNEVIEFSLLKKPKSRKSKKQNNHKVIKNDKKKTNTPKNNEPKKKNKRIKYKFSVRKLKREEVISILSKNKRNIIENNIIKKEKELLRCFKSPSKDFSCLKSVSNELKCIKSTNLNNGNNKYYEQFDDKYSPKYYSNLYTPTKKNKNKSFYN